MSLRQGSRIAIISPASAANEERIDAGIAALAAWGYEPVLMPAAKARGPLYYAGPLRARLDDLHAAFADPSIDAILCTRGGWGSAELLEHLDLALIAANRKPFIGYSDQTSLQAYLWSALKLPTVYGPMCAADWSLSRGADETTWRAVLERTCPWQVNKHDGIRMLRSGSAQGRLLGGCLSILEAGLGTRYALKLDEPTILFLEDIGTKPYQWDRMLLHLRYAGMFERVTGIVFGDMSANVEPNEMPLLENALLHALSWFDGPITIGLRCGHVTGGNRSLLLGDYVALENDTLRSVL
ncbi:LD-carboxypeptidase [Granulicella cerasi]|uniref:LD-carboxypeptidase n=1 Tax=Granulicella cerasi TaxID=741063 RepID=A0ABW1ZCW2_9BACT|nr:LD-carboxypeptidase [Granulicella cerasi]